ncbi:hypothetical protein [Vibrio owensii]|uniref:hypothetical protein n=1 Tax=Vibrio harveyi group TaxID=717610 RepID=UPI003CC6325F
MSSNNYNPNVYLKHLEVDSEEFKVLIGAFRNQKEREAFTRFVKIIADGKEIPRSKEKQLFSLINFVKNNESANGVIQSLIATADKATIESAQDAQVVVNNSDESKEEIGEVITQSNGSWSIKFPGRSEPTTFLYAEFTGQEEIESNTIVLTEDNSRNQKNVLRGIDRIASLINAAGQIMPAFGHKVDSDKISVLDGSRRRCGCIVDGTKPFKIFYCLEKLTPNEVAFLKSVFATQQENAAYEQCYSFLLDYEQWKEEQDKLNEVSIIEAYGDVVGVPKSTATRNIRVGKMPREIIELFPDIYALKIKFLSSKLKPFIDRATESTAKELIGKHAKAWVDVNADELPDDCHFQILDKCVADFEKMSGGLNVKKPSTNPPKFLLGAKGAKNYVSTSVSDKGVLSLKAKLEPTVLDEINDAIESLLKSKGLID